MKQNLAPLRIVSFAAIAWLAAVAVRYGWLIRLASRASSIVNVGQQGMPCFVAGAVASLVIDTALRATAPHHMPFVAGLVGDAFAIAVVLTTAWVARLRKQRITQRSARAPATVVRQAAHRAAPATALTPGRVAMTPALVVEPLADEISDAPRQSAPR
jgi:hypothetical protein